ncbi:MAG: tyrosine-type recombinase/integrase [Polyangiaceae bacterium]|nr:tyrosine-type recombinase/integrase [Polyangiaceae bacterium]
MLLPESKMKGMPEEPESGRPEGSLVPREGVPEGERLIALVLDSVTSPESRRAYGRGLREFLAWLPPRPFTRAAVQEYRAFLESRSLSPSTINLRLAPIRKLALEASDNGLLDPARAVAIARVKGVRRHGVRLGTWVGAEDAGRLLASPYTGSLRGKRDRAILAVLLGCALRRSELVALRVEDLQEREGRAVFADIAGKGGRVRTVPVPKWVREAIVSWTKAAGISSGRIFRAIGKGDRVRGEMTGAGVLGIVRRHSLLAGIETLAPHDLRRTCARLCRAAGGGLEQIQMLLGHASLQTTERYLGSQQEIASAVNDRLGIPLGGRRRAKTAAPPDDTGQ